MFTGIIQASGRIAKSVEVQGDRQLLVDVGALDISALDLGASVAVNGVCLTVTRFESPGFWADVSVETLTHTTLGDLRPGSQINLEKSLTPSSSLGGHWVSGHVDGVGDITAMTEDARSIRFDIRVPQSLARYIAHKGSVCVDGTSLTVNAVRANVFDVNIIPHTMQETLFGTYAVGTRVNIEVDVIARYLERLSSYSAS